MTWIWYGLGIYTTLVTSELPLMWALLGGWRIPKYTGRHIAGKHRNTG